MLHVSWWMFKASQNRKKTHGVEWFGDGEFIIWARIPETIYWLIVAYAIVNNAIRALDRLVETYVAQAGIWRIFEQFRVHVGTAILVVHLIAHWINQP